eukprot:scaffold226_cov302-Prasinococcus_capsulatus_cf.AAC.2
MGSHHNPVPTSFHRQSPKPYVFSLKRAAADDTVPARRQALRLAGQRISEPTKESLSGASRSRLPSALSQIAFRPNKRSGPAATKSPHGPLTCRATTTFII